MSPQAAPVIARLDRTRRQWWICSLTTGLLFVSALALGLYGAFALVDALIGLSQRGLLILFVGWALLTAGALGATALWLRRARRSLAATARQVELEMPELESHLINLVQFSADGQGTDPFREAAAP
jgi:hypothetical protein